MKPPSLPQLLLHYIFMRLPAFRIRREALRAQSNNLDVSYDSLIAHHLAGGRVSGLVDGLIYAQQQKIQISYLNACVRDLVCASGTRISLIEHIQVLERSGYRSLDGVPLDLANIKST